MAVRDVTNLVEQLDGSNLGDDVLWQYRGLDGLNLDLAVIRHLGGVVMGESG